MRFHAASFCWGLVLGALVVITTAYLPELLDTPSAPVATPGAAQPPAADAAGPQLTFEFDDLLRNSRVTADPQAYRSEPEEEADATEEYLLQAASFRARDDAERLRAALLLMDLPATTSAISLANGSWYRVTVGPFSSRVQADRAMTRLREQNIAAIWTKRRPGG